MTSKGWQNAWHMLWLKQIKITLGEIEMKKLLAMILALGVTFSICTSCGSSYASELMQKTFLKEIRGY